MPISTFWSDLAGSSSSRLRSSPRVVSGQSPSSIDFDLPTGGGSSGVAPTSTGLAGSKERMPPERIDVNSIFNTALRGEPGVAGLQVAEVVGKAPGFVYERPVALLDTLAQGAGLPGLEKTIGDIPILGSVLGGVGDLLTNVSNFLPAIKNSSDLTTLRSIPAGASDDTPLSEFGLTAGQPYYKTTVGQFREQMRKRGFTQDDLDQIAAGTKSTFDYGDHALADDPLADVAFRLVGDPLNLMLGTGLLTKTARGAGLLAKAVATGAELKNPLRLTEAIEAVSVGNARAATWAGVAGYMGRAAEAAGSGLKTYRKLAIGTTAVELGIEAASSTPLGGFLGGLQEVNRAVMDNHLLSDNMAFAIWAGFHFPLRGEGGLGTELKNRLGEVKYRAFGSDIQPRIVEALTEGKSFRNYRDKLEYVHERIGGPEGLDDLTVQVLGSMAHKKVAPALAEGLSHFDSLTESVLANRTLDMALLEELGTRLERNDIKGRDVVAALKDWHSYRPGPGGQINKVAYPWDGELAMQRWVEYSAAATPLSRIFQDRLIALVGSADDPIPTVGLSGVLSKHDISTMQVLFKSAAVDGRVPRKAVERVLSTAPQLIALDTKGFWEKLLIEGQPDPKLDSVIGKLGQHKKDASSLRDITHEFAQAEQAAPRDVPEPAPAREVAILNASPWRSDQFGVRRTVVDAAAERSHPSVQAIEHNVADVYEAAGLPVHRVEQTIGAYAKELEPGFETWVPDGGTLQDYRLRAALYGSGRQESVLLTIQEAEARRLGLATDGREARWYLPEGTVSQLERAAAVIGKEFDGWTLRDGDNLFKVAMAPEWLADLGSVTFDQRIARINKALQGIFKGDAVGDRGIAHSIKPVYVESIGKESFNHATYDQVLGAAGADERVAAWRAAEHRLADEGPGGGRPVVQVASGQSPAEVIGLGGFDRAQSEGGFLYHVTSAENARDIAGDALRPAGPDFRGEQIAWPWSALNDHPRSKRIYWNRDVAAVEKYTPEGEPAILRVREERANRVRNEPVGGDQYTNRLVPAKDIEVLGADGQWHPIRGFFDPSESVPASLQPALDAVEPVLASRGTPASALFEPIEPTKGVQEARDLAGQYMTGAGIRVPERRYFTVDPDFGLRTARAYDALPSAPVTEPSKVRVTAASIEKATNELKATPVEPEVRAAYQAFVDETRRQYDFIRASGIEIVPTLKDPYKNSAEMMADVRENRRLKVFAGSADHPLLTNDQNVMFRAVHDFFAHAAEGFQFGPRGEVNAAIKHSQMYGPEARAAMLTETHGQNSFVNYSDKPSVAPDVAQEGNAAKTVAEVNKEKPGSIYADQKAALLPRDILDEFEAKYIGSEVGPVSRESKLAQAIRADQDVQQVARATGQPADSDFVRGRVLYNAQLDEAVSKVLPITRFEHGRINAASEEFRAAVSPIEQMLHELGPQYTIKPSPKLAWLYDKRAHGPVISALRDREGLALWLFHDSPLAPLTRFVEFLTAPVHSSELATASRQAMYAELVPAGATPEQIDRFVDLLAESAREQTIGSLRVTMHRGIGGNTANRINDIARDVLPRKVVEAVGDGKFDQVLDRSLNRFIRDVEQKQRAGTANRLQTAMDAAYRGFQDTTAGHSSRMVSKVFYTIFRFILDPRWWAMNVLEADLLGGLKYGKSATRLEGANRAAPGKAALVHGGQYELAAKDADTGWMYIRNLAGYISRAFDKDRPDTILSTLRGMDDEGLTAIRKLFPDAEGEADLVAQIDDMLYNFDTKGVGETIAENLHHFGDEQALQEPGAAAMIQRIYDANQKTFDDIVRVFEGNASRSTIERLMNSYWLYWPISYQLKAGRWLFDLLTDRAFGRKTNLAGAATYAQLLELHRDRVENDPQYAEVFSENPTFWQLAQMMLPITPGDLGVSLSRPVRYGGSALRDATGGDKSPLGFWGQYKAAQDPLEAAGAITNLGLPYTLDLLLRVKRESLNTKPEPRPAGSGLSTQ